MVYSETPTSAVNLDTPATTVRIERTIEAAAALWIEVR